MNPFVKSAASPKPLLPHKAVPDAPRPDVPPPAGAPPAGSASPPLTAADPIAPAGLTTPALEDELVSLAGHLTAAHCRWLLLLAEFDARDGWGGPGMRSCAHWLAWRVGMSVRTALDQLRVARALATLPAITSSFAEGRISYSKVRAITRIATPETEQPLLELALAGTAGHVERVVRLTRQASARPDVEGSQRSVRWYFDDEGCLLLTARLPAEQGAALVATLNTLVDELDRNPAQRSAERGQPGTSPGNSAQRSAERGQPSSGANTPPTIPAPTMAARHAEPMQVRRADALVAMATGLRPTNAEVVVHLDVDRHEAQVERGPGVPVSTAERLACDARVRPLLRDRRGNPLYLGRTRRLVSKTLLAAVRFRDDHQCRFPGCTHTRWLHAHHIRHWLRGGGTDIDNLVMLCEFHHQLVHDHGFQVRGRGTRLRFIAPNGQQIPPAGPPTEGTSRTLVELSNSRGGGKDSLTPTWAGERLDPTSILMRLLPERRPARAAA